MSITVVLHSFKISTFILLIRFSFQMSNRNRQSGKKPTVALYEPSETAPLNENNLRHDQPTEPPRNQEVTSSLNMDAETKKVLIKIAIDVALLCCGELVELFCFEM